MVEQWRRDVETGGAVRQAHGFAGQTLKWWARRLARESAGLAVPPDPDRRHPDISEAVVRPDCRRGWMTRS